MKRFIMAMMVMLACGCSHSAPPPTMARQEPQLLPDKCSQRPCDNFDRAGDAVSSGSRYIWNYAAQAWERLDTPENRERASKAWQVTRDTADKMYEVGKSSLIDKKD